jgi:hypothetical protein
VMFKGISRQGLTSRVCRQGTLKQAAEMFKRALAIEQKLKLDDTPFATRLFMAKLLSAFKRYGDGYMDTPVRTDMRRPDTSNRCRLHALCCRVCFLRCLALHKSAPRICTIFNSLLLSDLD